jgi:hypothetical protein
VGRLFRVTTKAAEKYVPQHDITKGDQWTALLQGLMSPNEDARYLAWKKLEEIGSEAEPELHKLFHDTNPPHSIALVPCGCSLLTNGSASTPVPTNPTRTT